MILGKARNESGRIPILVRSKLEFGDALELLHWHGSDEGIKG